MGQPPGRETNKPRSHWAWLRGRGEVGRLLLRTPHSKAGWPRKAPGDWRRPDVRDDGRGNFQGGRGADRDRGGFRREDLDGTSPAACCWASSGRRLPRAGMGSARGTITPRGRGDGAAAAAVGAARAAVLLPMEQATELVAAAAAVAAGAARAAGRGRGPAPRSRPSGRRRRPGRSTSAREPGRRPGRRSRRRVVSHPQLAVVARSEQAIEAVAQAMAEAFATGIAATRAAVTAGRKRPGRQQRVRRGQPSSRGRGQPPVSRPASQAVVTKQERRHSLRYPPYWFELGSGTWPRGGKTHPRPRTPTLRLPYLLTATPKPRSRTHRPGGIRIPDSAPFLRHPKLTPLSTFTQSPSQSQDENQPGKSGNCEDEVDPHCSKPGKEEGWGEWSVHLGLRAKRAAGLVPAGISPAARRGSCSPLNGTYTCV